MEGGTRNGATLREGGDTQSLTPMRMNYWATMRRRKCRIVRILEENENSGIGRRVKIISLWYVLQDTSDCAFRLGAF